jgi:hypothetical protein
MIKRQQGLNGCQTTILRNNIQQTNSQEYCDDKDRTNAEESNTCVSLLFTAHNDDAGKM